jgi:hypothetical protein
MLLEPMNGQIVTAKMPSAPADRSRSFVAGIGAAVDEAEIAGAAIQPVPHGTAVATRPDPHPPRFLAAPAVLSSIDQSKGRGAAQT